MMHPLFIGRVFFALLLPLSSITYAQQDFTGTKFISPPVDLGLVSFVAISIDDQVSDGCWTNAENIKSNLRLKFEQNDIETIKYKMYSSDPFHPIVLLRVVGGNPYNKFCVGYASIEVGYGSYSIYGSRENNNRYTLFNSSRKFDNGALFTSGKKLNSQLSKFFDANSSELIADIIAGRRDLKVKAFRSEYPTLFEKPISQVDYDKKIEELKSKN